MPADEYTCRSCGTTLGPEDIGREDGLLSSTFRCEHCGARLRRPLLSLDAPPREVWEKR
jgi:DNA-directed RNA polymerase subunit RPC12/RpoP